jgi:aminoglycoside phosphotransferase (APT) family kinase protein
MVEARNITDPNLSLFSAREARKMYQSLCETLATLHQVDYAEIGLGDFGKPDKFFERQLERWSNQFKSEVLENPNKYPEMLELEQFLRAEIKNIPTVPASIIHGDFRIDNVLFHPFNPEIISILDVELATIGHSLSDVALLPVYHEIIRDGYLGPKPKGPKNPGIPSDVDFVHEYFNHILTNSRRFGSITVANWNVLSAFCYWRVAAIFHGVYSRSRAGNASSPRAITFGSAVPVLAKKGLEIANSVPLKISC